MMDLSDNGVTMVDIDIGELVQEWDGRTEPAYVLLPHLRGLTDSDVRRFYDEIAGKGYQGAAFATVRDLHHLRDTVRLITSAVLGEYISFGGSSD